MRDTDHANAHLNQVRSAESLQLEFTSTWIVALLFIPVPNF